MLSLHGPLHGNVGFTHFLYCTVQQLHPCRVVGWWLTVPPPTPKKGGGEECTATSPEDRQWAFVPQTPPEY